MKCEACNTNKVLKHEKVPENTLCGECLTDLFEVNLSHFGFAFKEVIVKDDDAKTPKTKI